MLKKVLNSLVFTIIFIFFFSCSSSEKTVDKYNLRVVVGTGGGAMGIWKGATIDTAGYAYEWEGRIQDSGLVMIGKALPDTLTEIMKSIKKDNLLNLDYKKPGNNSLFIKIISPEKENYILWSSNEENDTTKTAYEFYKKIIKMAYTVK